MRVAVTGATGHIGGVLIRRLISLGHDVRALTHGDTTVLDGLPITSVPVDVRDPVQVRAALDDIDVIVHLAALISLCPDDEPLMRAINVEGVRHVAEAALEAGVRRMIHVSSVHAFATWRLPAPLREDDARADGPATPAYDRSKADGERELHAVIARGLDAVILQPVGVLGPGDHGTSLLGHHLREMARGRQRVLPDGGFCWVDVRDVVDAIIAAMDRGRVGASYLLSGGFLSSSDLQRIALQTTGGTPWALRLPVPLLRALCRGAHHLGLSRLLPPGFTPDALYALDTRLRVDPSRARRELGLRPRCLVAAVEDAIGWWQAHDMLPPCRRAPTPQTSLEPTW